MFCGECGTENPDTNRFCKNCGKPLRNPQPGGVAAPMAAAAPASQVPEVKPPRNWLGIGSIVFGILAWILIPYILGAVAIILGVVSVYKIKKEQNILAVAGIAGCLVALAAMLVNFFYIFIF
jgi:hypothetical protein